MAAPTTTVELARPDDELVRANALDEDDQPRAPWERAVGWGIVAIATWLVWCILDANHDWLIHFHIHAGFIPVPHFTTFKFGDLFANTTTNGGDMGAHVWWPRFLEHNWFPKFRLAGWTPDWYDGFPVGQYYFPLPAVAIALIDHIPFVPYNVAFKLVTVSGPLLLPAAAYYFAKGMRAPWPAPPAFALAALGMLVETRTDWQIYGGNIASTLAGEFSFTIGLAFALFGLGALAHTLDTGKRRWLPAVLIACAIMSHIVVGIFIAVAATLLWLTRRAKRTWPLAVSIGAVAIAIPAIWLLPLLGNQAYTQSMRYTKLIPTGKFTLWSWLPLPHPVRNALNGLVRALGSSVDPNTHKAVHQPLWLPWWIWALGCVAIVAAGWYRRRSTLVLLVLAFVLGIMFVEWPEHAIWNTRFLPFWLLTCGFIAAMGAAEICRLAALLAQQAYRWIRDGDLQDARARAWAELATADDDPTVDPSTRKDAAWALAERRFDADPAGWKPPLHLSPENITYHARMIGAAALAIVVGIAGFIALNRAWDARNGNPAIAITGWAQWNYSGYERKAAYPQFKAVLDGMESIADNPQYGPGRALWEPSSGDPDAINTYGTSLALELLPYFTNGKIGSMEGIYFESSATTSYHFLTVAECSEHPSNPVRGLKYGTVSTDFDLCVKHLQMLGVRYLMLWTDESNKEAAQHSELKKILTIPQNPPISGPAPDNKLSNWTVYEVSNSDFVVGLDQTPTVVTNMHGGKYHQCWGTSTTESPEPDLNNPWECTMAPWWENRAELDTMFAQSGPKDWPRAKASDMANVQHNTITPTQVTDVSRNVDTIKFDVSEIGKPVLVKESYYPNWQVKGAKGPYRVAPNLMVVVPTSQHVTLSYGLTKIDWLGRIVTVLGLGGIAVLSLWTGGTRFAAERTPTTDGDDTDQSGNGNTGNGDNGQDGDDEDTEPPKRHWEPAAVP